jgi:hypothetical protein
MRILAVTKNIIEINTYINIFLPTLELSPTNERNTNYENKTC